MSITQDVEMEGNAMIRVAPDAPNFNMPVDIPIVVGPTLSRGTKIVAGVMPAGILIPHNYEIPYYDPRTREGYQRPPHQARINELARELLKGDVDLPTSILLNIRNKNAVEAVKGNKLQLEVLLGSTALSRFYVVDGQHRILALAKLIEDDPYGDRWLQFTIPFVCMLGADQYEEMRQFYIVNTKAKSVSTDLAYGLLKERVAHEPQLMDSLIEKGKVWQVEAERIVENLADKSSVWRGLIKLPAMAKGSTTMPSASMVLSLRPLLTNSTLFKNMDEELRVKVLEAYWKGLREILRPAFDEPKEFVLQKGIGVVVLHTILVDVLEIVRAKGFTVTAPESYKSVLQQALDTLRGENSHGEPVYGVNFWRSAPDGAAGAYSSSSGRRVLIGKLQHELPKLEEIA